MSTMLQVLVSPLVKMSCWPVCKGGSSVLKQVWLIISLSNIYGRKHIFVQNLLEQECYESLDCINVVTRYIWTSYAQYPWQPFNVLFFWSPYWLKFYPVMKPNVQMAIWPVAVVVTCYECVHGCTGLCASPHARHNNAAISYTILRKDSCKQCFNSIRIILPYKCRNFPKHECESGNQQWQNDYCL